jgi:mycoredoxin
MSELSLNQNTLIIYTTPWCGDCRRVKQLLDDRKIPYIEINIDQDPQAAQFVEAINEGYRSVPTLVFPDGTTLTEPSNPELIAAITKLGNVNSING